MRSRVKDAVLMFESGYNCAQSVFVTYADIFGLDRVTALHLSSPMGAGVGRMREICGTVSAMAMLEGLKEGNTDPLDEKAKTRVYQRVRKLSDDFKMKKGSIICRELLGLECREDSAAPSERTAGYYQKRPCAGLVAEAAKLVEEQLLADIISDKV